MREKAETLLFVVGTLVGAIATEPDVDERGNCVKCISGLDAFRIASESDLWKVREWELGLISSNEVFMHVCAWGDRKGSERILLTSQCHKHSSLNDPALLQAPLGGYP